MSVPGKVLYSHVHASRPSDQGHDLQLRSRPGRAQYYHISKYLGIMENQRSIYN